MRTDKSFADLTLDTADRQKRKLDLSLRRAPVDACVMGRVTLLRHCGESAMADDVVDVLIIGAGASGVAVAWSLADTRMRIVCFEQGDWTNPSDYPSTAAKM